MNLVTAYGTSSLPTCPTILAVSLLSPAFAVAGLLLAAIPILIHLINRRRHRTMRWAAMGFLLQAMNADRARLRFEHWLLLAMRCLILVLAGLAFAQPVGCDNRSSASTGNRTGLYVLIIDNGCSMAYQTGKADAATHLEQAKRLAAQMIDRMHSGDDAVAIITAAKPAENLVAAPTYDLQQAKAIVERIPQCYGNTDLAGAIRVAIRIGNDHPNEPNKSACIITDGTASAWEDADADLLKTEGPELARLFHVTHVNLATGRQWNQAITELKASSNLITTRRDFGADFIATPKSFGSAREASIQWKIDGKVFDDSGIIHIDTNTLPQIEPQAQIQAALNVVGHHAVTASIIGNDGLQVDNTRTRIITVVPELKTLIVEGQHRIGRDDGSGGNLRIALTGLTKSGQSEGISAPELVSDLELESRILADYRVVILCGVTQFSAEEADRLRTFVTGGGTLMIFVGDAISADNYNSLLLPRHLMPGRLTRRVLANEGSSFHFDFNPNGVVHPLLSAFAHQDNTGIDTAEAFGYWKTDVPLDPQLRVLNWRSSADSRTGSKADADSKPDPAITAEAVGQGRVVYVSTSASEEWITFTRKPIYTELFNELLARSVCNNDDWLNLSVGDRLIVPSSFQLASPPVVLDPAQAVIPLVSVRKPDGSSDYQSPPLMLPGQYTLRTTDGDCPVAVNIPAEASDVRTVNSESIKAALGGIDLAESDNKPAVETAGSAVSHNWGWVLMTGAACLLIAESMLATRFSR